MVTSWQEKYYQAMNAATDLKKETLLWKSRFRQIALNVKNHLDPQLAALTVSNRELRLALEATLPVLLDGDTLREKAQKALDLAPQDAEAICMGLHELEFMCREMEGAMPTPELREKIIVQLGKIRMIRAKAATASPLVEEPKERKPRSNLILPKGKGGDGSRLIQ